MGGRGFKLDLAGKAVLGSRSAVSTQGWKLSRA